MKLRRAGGFTLLELLIGMTLVGFILALLFSGLNLGTRSWEAGEERIATSSRQAIVVDFLRRTLEQAYPLRWREGDEERLAFAGEAESLRFVGPVPMHGGTLVNQVVILGLADGEAGRSLVMRWRLPDLREPGFEPAEAAEPKVLIKGIERLSFSYYGAESDAEEPAWHDRWTDRSVPPELIRMQLVMSSGEPWPDIVAAPRVRAE